MSYRGFAHLFAALLAIDAAGTLHAQNAVLVPPPEPSVRPFVAERYPNDQNGDRIADGLVQEIERLETLTTAALTTEERTQATNALADTVEVELVFNQQITQNQINTFTNAGGQISYVYRAVSYGWNGRIPRNQIKTLPGALGATLVLVDEVRPMQLHMDTATRTGRVRPIWASGFAGNVAGFDGDSNITIAVVDTGVDESHTDLNGRRVYWHDFSSDAFANPTDRIQHGSHVTGIATGTGAASGSGSGTLFFTEEGDYTGVPVNNFFPSPIELPDSSVTVTFTATWNGGGGSQDLYCVYRSKGASGGYTVQGSGVSGSSPLTLTVTFTPDTNRVYSPALVKGGGMTTYNIKCEITGYPGAGDGFNKLRGVAPACSWAGAKVFNNAGSGSSTSIDAGIDDLVANRVANNIKVMNLSLGVIGNPGIDATERQKINTAVNNGIVVTLSAGNDGGTQQVDDPGRAAMALTVAAANDVNQLTDYTSEGFASPGSTAGQEEDYKPDLMAPGGSAGYYSSILSVDSNSGDGAAFSDQQANDYYNIQGTSMASPFAAGCAALVIDALQQTGVTWDFNSSQHSRLVKMLLCATASESNLNREGGANNPTLQRATGGPNGFPAGKDQYEGYGMINPDAAVEAVGLTLPSGTTGDALGPSATDRRVWARSVNLTNGQTFTANLTVPGGGDFDLYLYSSTPTAYGTPTILSSSTQSGNGAAESINYSVPSTGKRLLVVKRISGSGMFSLTTTANLPPVAQTNIISRSGTNGVKVAASSLLGNDTDPDGDALSVSSVGATSTNGGTVTISGSWIFYTPPAGYTGVDSFTYTISDGHGGTYTTNVYVQVPVDTAQSQNSKLTVEGSNLRVRFYGIPGRTYQVQFAEAVPTNTWFTLTSLTANALGVFEYLDTNGPSARYYRSIQP